MKDRRDWVFFFSTGWPAIVGVSENFRLIDGYQVAAVLSLVIV